MDKYTCTEDLRPACNTVGLMVGQGYPAVPISGSSPHRTFKFPAVRAPPDPQGTAWLGMSPGAQSQCLSPPGSPRASMDSQVHLCLWWVG